MFDHAGAFEDLDKEATLARLASNRVALLEQEAAELVLAAHWADLHSEESAEGSGIALPGTERLRRIGAHGTPPVYEFAPAEFAAVNHMQVSAAENLIADALDLRHRHSLTWAGVRAYEIRAWKARKVAHLTATAGLRLEQAQWVDAQVVDFYDALPWTQFLDLVEAKIIEVDPEAAEARRKAAALDQFVHTGQCNEFGLKTVIAKARAGDAIFFVAMVNRIAQILAEQGDRDPIGVRRAKALGILANPARALRLLEDSAIENLPDTVDPEQADKDGCSSGSFDDPTSGSDPETVGEGDVHPTQNDADDPAPETHPCPTCDGDGTVSGDPSAFSRPVVKVDPKKLLPDAILHLHLNQDSFTREGNGVVRFEGVGPVTVPQAAEFLGPNCNVSIAPVIDVAHQESVNAYETPARIREALHLRNPACVFPWSTNLSRTKDSEHTIPYLSPDKGGPPGQTGMWNLGMMGRFPHRLKTHGRWRLRQPAPGVFLWRTPHGWYFTVDHTGTHELPKAVGDAAWARLGLPARPGSRAGVSIDIHPADDLVVVEYEPARHHAA